MVPSGEATPAHQIMEEAHKDVNAAAGHSNNYWADEDDASTAAATARSLAERMQRTFPFAQSPLPRPPPLSRPGSFRLDAIMNAEDVMTNAAMDMDDDSSSAHGSSFSYGNENSNQNSNDARPQELHEQQHLESGKSSLAFILGNDRQSNQQQRDPSRRHDHALQVDAEAEEDEDEEEEEEDNDWGDASSDASFDRRDTSAPRSNSSDGGGGRKGGTATRGSRAAGKSPAAAARRAAGSGSSSSRSQIKKSRICKFDGCTRYVVNRGLCIGHGGGKRCAIAGCASSAKNLGVCWKHGGSTKCTIDGCDNRAKSRGVCWSHGGGKNCSGDGCTKTAVSNGLCWAHGGGKRCVVEGCKKPAYERNGNLCSLHQLNGA